VTPGHNLPGHSPDGKHLRIAANLQAVLDLRRVDALVGLEHEGPQLRVYRCALRLDVPPERVEKLAGSFAQAAHARQCTITRADNGTLLIELPKPESERRILPALSPTELPTYSSSAVPVGVTPDGSTGWLDLADERHAHLLICGTTGSGKSICLRWLLYRLFGQKSLHALRALLLDPKGDLRAFAGVPHLLHPPAQDAMEMQRLLGWTVGELDWRTAAHSVSPRLIVVVEEMPDLVLVHPDIGAALTRIAQVGRSAGINLIGTAQLVGDRGAWLTTPTNRATAGTPGWSSSQASRGCQRVGAARRTWPHRAARNGPRSGGRGTHSCHYEGPPSSARGDRGNLIPHAGWSIR
jgi:DNA segregation ATPase FtsK/SpoIIIE, S-DNA-T family